MRYTTKTQIDEWNLGHIWFAYYALCSSSNWVRGRGVNITYAVLVCRLNILALQHEAYDVANKHNIERKARSSFSLWHLPYCLTSVIAWELTTFFVSPRKAYYLLRFLSNPARPLPQAEVKCQGLFIVPIVPEVPIGYTASQLLTLYQHRANNQWIGHGKSNLGDFKGSQTWLVSHPITVLTELSIARIYWS